MKKQKSQKGFTIAELLVVVAILAILLTFAAPAVIRAFVRMHLTSLDNSACTIFAAAQNRMTAMVGNGELETFAKDITGNEVPRPKDFPTENGHGDSGDLRYLDSEIHQDILKKLLPGGSIESKLAEHHYVVEYNYKTGAVYAVWYSDEDEDFKYDDIAAQERGFEERLGRSPLVGYYGGSGVDYAKAGQMPIPELTLTNAEELRLVIKIPSTPTPFDPNSIGLTVTVSSMDGSRSKEIITKDNNVLLDQNAIKPGTVVLDTLKPSAYSDNTYANTPTGNWTAGDSFKGWMSLLGGSLDPDAPVPGEDITVTVTTYYAGEDGQSYLPQSASVSTNSLFAAVEKKDDPATSGTTEEIPTAMIAYGRHLQNLDSATSGVDPSGTVVSITAAEQTQPIDFAADADDAIYSWKKTYTDASTPVEYKAIYNTNLTHYNGNGLPISNLKATKNNNATDHTGDAGLFAYFAGTDASNLAKLENITLIDPAVEAANNAGALAGQVSNAEIVNCQVYLAATDPSKGEYPEPDAAPGINNTSGSPAATTAGGLVGTASGTVSITDSFAATVVAATASTGSTGGLVGATDAGANLTIEKSYAACHLNGGSTVGGLVGKAADAGTVSITNSYAAGVIAKVNDGGTAAGLITNAPTGSGTLTIKNSYAAVVYGEAVKTASTATASPTVTVYGAAPDVTAAAVSPTPNVYYIQQTGVTYQESSGTSVNTKQLSEMEELPATGGVPAQNYLDGD